MIRALTASRHCSTFLVFSFLAAFTVGCGGEKLPEPMSISGTVLQDGQPKGDLELTFSNEKGGVPAQYRHVSAKTGADGKYEVKQIMPGEYRVSVGSIAPAGGGPAQAVDTDPLAKYRVDSPLTATLAKGGKTTFDFDLKTK